MTQEKSDRELLLELIAAVEELPRVTGGEEEYHAAQGDVGMTFESLLSRFSQLRAALAASGKEVKRLKDGTVSVDEFADGCRAEMVKLYGSCPWDDPEGET